MFTEAEKREYQSIRAPESLRERVLAQSEAPRAEKPRAVPRRRWLAPAMAACLMLALLVTALLPRADLTVSVGEALSGGESGIAMMSRAAAPLRLPVTVTTGGEATLSVSRGRLCDEAGESIDRVMGGQSLFWEIDDPDEAERYTLTARCGGESLTLTLAFDAADGRWTAHAAEE